MLKHHLVDLLSICYTANFAKISDKWNRWSLGLSRSVGGLERVGAIISSPSSATLFITLHGVQWRFFSKFTAVHKKGHMSKTTPLLGVICHSFGKT